MTPHPARLQAEDVFHNVLVGVDDYEGGRDALELAKTLRSGDDGITIVYVEILQSRPAPEADAGADAEIQRFGLERLARLRAEAQIPAEVERIQAPSVRRGLHELAADRAADLIVIGASRRNEVARSLLGDEVRELLADPPCAVAVAPIGHTSRSALMRKIGVAYDGSPESEQALALARKLAAERHATVSAFEVVPPPVYVGDYSGLERDVKEEIDAAQQRIAALGGLEPHAEFADDPVEALRRFGASVDLLVLGAHEYGPPDHLLHRSKAQRLAEDPPSPLLVLSSAERQPVRPHVHDRPTGIGRIAVGVGGRAEARDATFLAMMIAGATGAEVTLVSVDTAPPVAIPPMPNRTTMHDRATRVLWELHDRMAPAARMIVDTDRSVPRALERVSQREQLDLLVVGSSPRAPEGRVRIGRRTRQLLLGDAPCALAVAAKGLGADGERQLTTIGVGYDGQPESREALRMAGALALAAGARLRVRAVADDGLVSSGWTPTAGPDPAEIWDHVVEPELESLREDAERAVSGISAEVAVEAKPGSPPLELVALSGEVDLLVIGSHRWGAAARVLLGWTGEEVMHGARCSVMVVPRPHSSPAARSDAGPAPEPA